MRKGDKVKNDIGRVGTVISAKPYEIRSAGTAKFVTVEWNNPHRFKGRMQSRVPIRRLEKYEEQHTGHYSRLGGTYWCDTCNSPYCERI